MKIFLSFLLFTSLYANSYKEGRNLYFQNGCSNCHGIEAEGSGNNPKLANKPQTYIAKRLKGFQEGKANTQAGEIMFEFARRLNDIDLQNISFFLANHKQDSTTKYKVSDDILGSVD